MAPNENKLKLNRHQRGEWTEGEGSNLESSMRRLSPKQRLNFPFNARERTRVDKLFRRAVRVNKFIAR